MSKKETKLSDEPGPLKLSSSIQSKRLKFDREPGSSGYDSLRIEDLDQKIQNLGINEPSKIIDPETSITEKYGTTSEPDFKRHPERSSSRLTSRSSEHIGKHHGIIEPNISTSWSPTQKFPDISNKSFVHSRGLVIGNVIIREGVFVGPFVSIRGDEEEPIYIGENSAILEGTMINALPTQRAGNKISQRLLRVGTDEYPLYISPKVTICQSVNIHGPAFIGKNTFVGMGSLIFWAEIGPNCVLEPGSLVINVKIPADRFVPAGQSVTSQKNVEALPRITEKYRFATINQELLEENREILQGYLNR